jgi:pyridoxamine 5'-phosphate oxidase family protein
MGAFSDAELRYLGRRRPARLATVGEDGYPRVVPVAFRYNPEVGAVDIGGHRFPEREIFRDVQRTGVAALLVDDLLAPRRPRAVEVRGDAVTLDAGGKTVGEDFDDQIIRLSPRRVVSWGLELMEPSGMKRPLLRRFVAFFYDLRPWIVLLTGLLAWLARQPDFVMFTVAERVDAGGGLGQRGSVVKVPGCRWRIEEAVQAGKGCAAWTSTRSAAGAPGTAGRPWPCLPMPSWW